MKSVCASLIKALALVLFGVVLALLIIEICFRLITQFSSKAIIRSDRPEHYFYDAQTPDMRNQPYQVSKPAGVFRIVVVGDSFTYGMGLEAEDTFSRRLERFLNLRKDGLRAEVLNFGVPGLSTADEVPLVKRAVDLKADLVILQVTLNDAELHPFNGTYHSLNKELLNHWSTPWFTWWKSLEYARTLVANTLSHSFYKQYYFDIYNNYEGWERFEQAFVAARRIVANHGQLVAVIFPLFSHPFDERYPFTPIHHKIWQMLKGVHVSYMDLFDGYRNMQESRLQILPGKDSHPNEIAHRIAAEKIYIWLASHNYLPDKLRVHTIASHLSNVPAAQLKHLLEEPQGSRPGLTWAN